MRELDLPLSVFEAINILNAHLDIYNATTIALVYALRKDLAEKEIQSLENASYHQRLIVESKKDKLFDLIKETLNKRST